MAQMNLFMRQKQAHTQREQTGVADGEGSGRERLGVWDVSPELDYRDKCYLPRTLATHSAFIFKFICSLFCSIL